MTLLLGGGGAMMRMSVDVPSGSLTITATSDYLERLLTLC